MKGERIQMKHFTKIVLVLILLLLPCAIFLSSCLLQPKEPEIEFSNFKLSECYTKYEFGISVYPLEEEINVGEVNDKETAVERAKELWDRRFPEDWCNSESWEKIQVSYDESENCWFVRAKYPVDRDGEEPCALFRSNGEVLEVFFV